MRLEKFDHWLKMSVLLGFLTCLLAACSNTQVNQPKELDRAFKDQINFKRVWKKSVGAGDQELKLQLSPMLRDDKIYSVDAEGALSAIDRFTGKTVWSHEVEERVSSGLALDRYSIYLVTFSGSLLSLDIQTGKENWRAPLSSEATAKPAVNGELVIVQTIDGKIAAFDAKKGLKRWRYDSVVPILSLRGTATPLVSRKYTVSSFANGELVALTNDTGRPLWKATLALPKGRTELERLVDSDGQPVLDGDRIYAVAYQGKVFALDATNGLEIWSKEVSSFNQVALGFGKLFITTAKGEVIALDKQSGKELWRNEDFLYRRLGSPLVFDQFVLTADLDGYIHVLSVVDGKPLARKYPDSDGVMGEMIIRGDRLYVYARSGHIVSYQLNPGEKQDSVMGSRFKKNRVSKTPLPHIENKGR